MQPTDIYIIRLSTTGSYPHDGDSSFAISSLEPRSKYVPWTVLPSDEAEAVALRAWVSTHQTMFLVTGASAAMIDAAITEAKATRFDQCLGYLRLATKLRLASSVYTMLPTVNRAIYEQYLRPAMTGARPGFSGVSSREAIAFAEIVSRLRKFCEGLSDQAVGNEVMQAMKECLQADVTWWNLHANAMSRMVAQPVSLAQLEFRRMNAAGERKRSHAEFLLSELQNVDALNTYDHFFGCVRVPLSPLQYLDELQFVLTVSDSYISDEVPYSAFRKLLASSISELRALAE